MNSSLTTATPKFSLLSFGKRGVGKTVFLAGSYAELHSYSQQDFSHQLWFDCQDSEVQTKIDDILSYIASKGKYPPSTMKIADFDFTMKSRSQREFKEIAHFRWWDIPGEFCSFTNTNFQTMLWSSNGCCVFIDAFELVHNNAYLQKLAKDVFSQVKTLAYLISMNRVKYRFALILTKCDLLKLDSVMCQRLEEKLQPLTSYFDNAKVIYKTFYSEIPIVTSQDVSTLKAKGSAAALLWLVSELSKVHNFRSLNFNVRNLFATDLKSSFATQQDLSDYLLHSLNNSVDQVPKVEKKLGLYSFENTRKYILPILVVGLVGVIGFSLTRSKWFHQHDPNVAQYEQILQKNPSDRNALKRLAAIHLEHKQFKQAIPLMEKLVQLEPKNLDLRLQLTKLYLLTDELTKAEIAYNQILGQQKNNFNALVGKAVLRATLGDTKTSKVLFVQAERVAPAQHKAYVRQVAQETLKEGTTPMPAAN